MSEEKKPVLTEELQERLSEIGIGIDENGDIDMSKFCFKIAPQTCYQIISLFDSKPINLVENAIENILKSMDSDNYLSYAGISNVISILKESFPRSVAKPIIDDLMKVDGVLSSYKIEPKEENEEAKNEEN